MVDKAGNDNLKRRDLDIVLEVNRKAIEMGAEVADQNEEIISTLKIIGETAGDVEKKIDSLTVKADHLTEKQEKLSRELFRAQVLFISGAVALIAQIVQIFIKK